jgi:phospholipid/cholesterol/gamma-HCH transport system permease protein
LTTAQFLQSRVGDGEELELEAAGAWTVAHARELDSITDRLVADRSTARSNSIDARGIEAFDTFGARMLDRLVRASSVEGRKISVIGLPERYQDLFNRVHDAGVKIAKPAAKPRSLTGPLGAVGESVVRTAGGLNGLLVMLGQISWAIVRVALNPRRFRMTSAIHQLDRVGWQAVPIILLITFLIGCIIAQQGFFHFRKFGADEYVVDMVGILILREIGVLIVAIMVAGRSGSAYTAELGSMKMREEIDALRTMGLDPVEILVLPRVIALIIALPMLDFVGSMAALYGGGLTAWLYGHMSPEIFVARLKDAISITHFKVGMIKAPFMALAIGVVACAEGFAVKGSAESLGKQTTASVVKSIFLVIVLDGLFAVFFAAIGM